MPQASKPILRICGANDNYVLKGQFKPAGDAKGFGFIYCPESRGFFGRDVYCPPDKAMGLMEGQWVAFNLFFNEDCKPCVYNIALCDSTWEPTPADHSQS